MNHTVNLSSFTAATDRETFASAMAYLRDHPGTTLIVPAGVYHITGELAKQAEHSVMSGAWGANPQAVMFCPRYRYDIGISFDGQIGTRMIADGAHLMVDGFMEPLSLTNCSDMEICGLTIDHVRKPYSRGVIHALGPTDEHGHRACMIEFDPDCPILEDTPMTLRHMFYDPAERRNVYPEMVRYTFVDALHIRAVLKDAAALRDGTLFYTSHTYHARPAIRIEHAKNIRLTDITIHSQPGMGVVGHRSEDVTLTRLSVIPSAGHHMSTNTDATHFTAMKGLLRFEDCTFDGQGDDFTNVHTYYHAVVGQEPNNTYLLQEKTPDGTHTQTPDYPDIGDTLELTDRTTLQTVGHYTVTACTPLPDEWMCRVTLDRPLPASTEHLVLSDITRLPQVEIVGCTASRHFARSVLLKNRSALVENCTFRDVMGPAIVAAAETWWYEGVCPAHITIRGNRITGCAARWGEAAIVVKADADRACGQSIFDIAIEDNVIDCPRGLPGIYIRNTDGVTVRGNTVTTDGAVSVHIEDCRRVAVSVPDPASVEPVASAEVQIHHS